MRILVVEDNPRMAALLCDALREARYAVDLAVDGVEAAELMAVEDFDLVILDWMLPQISGLELLRAWRREGNQTPVLMLTGRDEVTDRVGGLDAGADDYLTKPFAVSELLARVRSLLRRRRQSLVAELGAGDLRMDRARRQVTVAGEAVELTSKEFGLLEYLLLHQGEVVSKNEIETHVWDSQAEPWGNVVEVLVHRLRKKINGGGRGLLRTVRGAGYVLACDRS